MFVLLFTHNCDICVYIFWVAVAQLSLAWEATAQLFLLLGMKFCIILNFLIVIILFMSVLIFLYSLFMFSD